MTPRNERLLRMVTGLLLLAVLASVFISIPDGWDVPGPVDTDEFGTALFVDNGGTLFFVGVAMLSAVVGGIFLAKAEPEDHDPEGGYGEYKSEAEVGKEMESLHAADQAADRDLRDRIEERKRQLADERVAHEEEQQRRLDELEASKLEAALAVPTAEVVGKDESETGEDQGGSEDRPDNGDVGTGTDEKETDAVGEEEVAEDDDGPEEDKADDGDKGSSKGGEDE